MHDSLSSVRTTHGEPRGCVPGLAPRTAAANARFQLSPPARLVATPPPDAARTGETPRPCRRTVLRGRMPLPFDGWHFLPTSADVMSQ